MLSKIVQQCSDKYAVVLEHHGLVTWGNTHEESYLKTIELEKKAQEYIKNHKTKKDTTSHHKLQTDQIEKLSTSFAWSALSEPETNYYDR